MNKDLRIVFVSNYFNHHQSALCQSLFKILNGNFWFIQTIPMDLERINLGWSIELPSYVVTSYKDETSYNMALELINTADVVIAGSASEKFLRTRLSNNKLIFRYSERIFKSRDFDIFRFLKYSTRILKNRGKKEFYLCCSSFAASDYIKCGVSQDNCYKWGYFPMTKRYGNIDEIIEKKKKNSILWVGRFLSWKHPELAIEVAKRLRDEGYDFILNMIGTGELETKLKKLVLKYALERFVVLHGAVKSSQVRTFMEDSEIFLFTSDRNEGWGAVLNEAMNSACGVVACSDIGAATFLIRHNKNGLTYKNKDFDSLYSSVCYLLKNKKERKLISKQAYYTMFNEWNADVAAKRVVELSNSLIFGLKGTNYVDDGPCTKIEI